MIEARRGLVIGGDLAFVLIPLEGKEVHDDF
jgi:hypothetical protein